MSLQDLVSEASSTESVTRNKFSPVIDIASSLQKALTSTAAKKVAKVAWVAHSIPCTAFKLIGLTSAAGVLDSVLENTYVGQKWNQYHEYIVHNCVAEVVGPLMGEVKEHRFSPIATYSQEVYDMSHLVFDGSAIATVTGLTLLAGYKLYKHMTRNTCPC